MLSHAKENARNIRLKYWKMALPVDAPLPDSFQERLQPNRPVPHWVTQVLPDELKTIRILDVNSGPASAIGTALKDREVRLVAVDELAREFEKLLQPHGMSPEVPVQFASPDDILAAWGPCSFDLIYSHNGLDFMEEPMATYRQLLECLAPHGRLVTWHEMVGDAERIEQEGFRFFHGLRKGRPVLRQRDFHLDFLDALPRAEIRWSVENDLLRMEMSLRGEICREVSLPRRPDPDRPLSPMISVHLPKTAGSTFRAFLESLYGENLRCLYAPEETSPERAGGPQFSPHIRCLHGHFRSDVFDERLPEALKVAWMRHPVERVVSSYLQFQRNPGSASESEFNKRIFRYGLGLMDFARTIEMRRQVRWYFHAVPLEEFFFIGITERFTESMRLLGHLLGRPLPADWPIENINPGKTGPGHYPLTRPQRSELEALYAEEIELYQYAEYRLERMLELIG